MGRGWWLRVLGKIGGIDNVKGQADVAAQFVVGQCAFESGACEGDSLDVGFSLKLIKIGGGGIVQTDAKGACILGTHAG